MINCIIILLVLSLFVILSKKEYRNNIYENSGMFSHHQTTIIKGIAIILILMSHISNTMDTVIFTPLGGIGVSIFLICSGYGLNESFKKSGLSGFWKKKVIRVLLPYIVVVTFLSIYKNSILSYYYLLDITGIKTTFWFVAYIIKWYLVFWITSCISAKYRIEIMILFALLFFCILPEIEAEQSLSFLTGVIISHKNNLFSLISKSSILKFSILSIFFGMLFLSIKQIPEVRTMHHLIFCMIQLFIKLPIAIGIVLSCRFVNAFMSSRFLHISGVISYELFLLQMPFYERIGGSILLGLLLILLLYPLSWLFHNLNILIAKLF